MWFFIHTQTFFFIIMLAQAHPNPQKCLSQWLDQNKIVAFILCFQYEIVYFFCSWQFLLSSFWFLQELRCWSIQKKKSGLYIFFFITPLKGHLYREYAWKKINYLKKHDLTANFRLIGSTQQGLFLFQLFTIQMNCLQLICNNLISSLDRIPFQILFIMIYCKT